MKEYNNGTKTPQNEYVNRPTPLEALKEMYSIALNDRFGYNGRDDAENNEFDEKLLELVNVIETALKALEVIKEKEVLSVYLDFYGCHLVVNNTVFDITPEEYDLLKEVLL